MRNFYGKIYKRYNAVSHMSERFRFDRVVFVICSILILGTVSVFAGNVFVGGDGIRSRYFSSGGNEGVSDNVVCLGENGAPQELVFEDGLFVGFEDGGSVEPVPDFPVDGLISYYKLDETNGDNIIDVYGDNNGTTYGSPAWTIGKISNCLDLEKTNSHGIEGTFSLNGDNDFTISMWIKMESSTEYMAIASTDISNTVPRGFQYQIGPSNELRLYDGTSISLQTANNVLIDGVWHHVILVNDAGIGYIYVDNNIEEDGIVNFNDVSNDFSFGMRGTLYDEFFDGLIDEVGIWDRALDSSEISDLYNNESGLPYQ